MRLDVTRPANWSFLICIFSRRFEENRCVILPVFIFVEYLFCLYKTHECIFIFSLALFVSFYWLLILAGLWNPTVNYPSKGFIGIYKNFPKCYIFFFHISLDHKLCNIDILALIWLSHLISNACMMHASDKNKCTNVEFWSLTIASFMVDGNPKILCHNSQAIYLNNTGPVDVSSLIFKVREIFSPKQTMD